MLHKLCRPSPLAPSPLAAALFDPAAAARQVGCTPNHLETLSPQTPQHGTALPAMLLQPSCGDSTCQRASHVGVDVALHGGDAAPSPGMRRHRAGCPGTGQKTREPLCGPRPSTSIALTWAGRGDRGDRLRCRGLSPPSGARCCRSRVGCFPNPLPPSCVPTVQLSALVAVAAAGTVAPQHMVELSGEEAAFPAANAGSLLCVALRFWAQRARLQSMSEGRQHCPGAEGSAYPAGSPHGLRHRAALLDEPRHQRSLGHGSTHGSAALGLQQGRDLSPLEPLEPESS